MHLFMYVFKYAFMFVDGPFPSVLKLKQHELFLDCHGTSPAALCVSAE